MSTRRLTPAEWDIISEAVALLDVEIEQNEGSRQFTDDPSPVTVQRLERLSSAHSKLLRIREDQGR